MLTQQIDLQIDLQDVLTQQIVLHFDLHVDLQVMLTQQIVLHFYLRLDLHFDRQVMLTQQIVLHFFLHFDLHIDQQRSESISRLSLWQHKSYHLQFCDCERTLLYVMFS